MLLQSFDGYLNKRWFLLSLARTKTHLVQSKAIAITCVCPYLFKMNYPFGVVDGERDYLVANTVHDVISLAAPTTILDNWEQGKTEQDFKNIAKRIDKDSSSIIDIQCERQGKNGRKGPHIRNLRL
ncbi:MAG: hypothetical protein WA364_25555 [Candidatus Nitrosopolaris sp.]